MYLLRFIFLFFPGLFLLCFSITSSLNARNYSISDTLFWAAEPVEFPLDKGNTRFPHFSGAVFSQAENFFPVYNKTISVPANADLTVSLTNEVFLPVSGTWNFDPNLLPTSIEPSVNIGRAGNEWLATISFIPLRINPFTGRIEALHSFELQVKSNPPSQFRQGSSRTYVANSVLSTGDWHKISADKRGIFKIDYSMLSSMGINPDAINPANIRMFGNGGGMLPEANDEPRLDDLQEISIYVHGQENGRFDPGDYILFYSTGPDRISWRNDLGRFGHQRNIYSREAFYFLCTNKGTGKRIGQQTGPGGSPSQTVTDFQDFQVYENDWTNLIQTGRQWYGDYFNFSQTTHTLNFSFPNLSSGSQTGIEVRTAARSTTSASTFSFSLNGANLGTMSVPAVCANYTCSYADALSNFFFASPAGGNLSLKIDFFNPSTAAEGWLDYITINANRNLAFAGPQMEFSKPSIAGIAGIAEYQLSNSASGVTIWDVTDHQNVRQQQITATGGLLTFKAATDEVKTFIAFDGSAFHTPGYAGKVANQNLHGLGFFQMIIVTHPTFRTAAETLAQHHRNKSNLTVVVTETNHIYNEFSSGAQDVTAIRDFVKMFYDRASNNPAQAPQYLLLFGDGSYDFLDYTQGNTNFVPVWQSENSLNPVLSFCSDDFFGLLDDNEGGNIVAGNSKLDVSIGRIPAKNATEAMGFVQKIIRYSSPESFGSWRNVVTFVSDDEDNNIHYNTAELLANIARNQYPVYNVDKIYLDAYQQQSTPGGSRYPDVNTAINNRIFSGTLIMNYVGHGGINGWAHERVLDINQVMAWDNGDRLPLFVTATCEFSRFDNPEKTSAGEILLMREKGGAIGLVTTVRLVYSSGNEALNKAFFDHVFAPVNGEMPTMGELMRRAKNSIASTDNNRKFLLLGDPATKLAYPQLQVSTTHINQKPVSPQNDTMMALAKVSVSGVVTDQNGHLLQNFNGVVYPTIFDKFAQVNTVVNDPHYPGRNPAGSLPATFDLQKNILYRGKATVTQGKFSFEFIVPKDIAYKFGNGKISYYTDNGITDGHGFFDEVIIGGTAENFPKDDQGPDITIYMNNEKFAFGGMTDENPILLIYLHDQSGINTSSAGVGHDITAFLNNDTKSPFVLNDFYESDLDSYQSGKVRYPLYKLPVGKHTLRVRAWDVYNNSNEEFTEFVVASNAKVALRHVYNYPNPFTTSTRFMFEHNRPGDQLDVIVQIYTVSGRVIKTIRHNIQSDGFRVDDIYWDGLDDFGDLIGRGVYIYRVQVRGTDGSSAHQFEKLVILR